jgi:hypothetical protein
MKHLSRVLFIISLLVLTAFVFDLIVEHNVLLLYIFLTGFTGSFITSYFAAKSTSNLLIRWLSVVVVAGFLLYIFVFGYLWSIADRP